MQFGQQIINPYLFEDGGRISGDYDFQSGTSIKLAMQSAKIEALTDTENHLRFEGNTVVCNKNFKSDNLVLAGATSAIYEPGDVDNKITFLAASPSNVQGKVVMNKGLVVAGDATIYGVVTAANLSSTGVYPTHAGFITTTTSDKATTNQLEITGFAEAKADMDVIGVLYAKGGLVADTIDPEASSTDLYLHHDKIHVHQLIVDKIEWDGTPHPDLHINNYANVHFNNATLQGVNDVDCGSIDALTITSTDNAFGHVAD